MSYLHEKSVWIAGGIGGTVSFLTEHTDISFTILLGMMLIDVLTGIAKGIQSKRLKSSIGHLGLMKKAGILLAVAMGYMLDILVNDGRPVFSIMMVWVSIGNEGLSVLENLSAMGVKAVPKQVKNVLAQMSENGKNIQSQKDGFVTVPVSDHSAQSSKEQLKQAEPVQVDENTDVDVQEHSEVAESYTKENRGESEVVVIKDNKVPEAEAEKASDDDGVPVDSEGNKLDESAKNKDGFR